MTAFSLHPQLAADTHLLAEWPLCRSLLMNDARFPWLILVPKRDGLKDLVDLLPGEQAAVMEEIQKASRALQAVYKPDKLNVAALGNVVPQLHIHIIARFKTDAAWPKPVWGVGEAQAYSSDELERIKAVLIKQLQP